MKALILAVFLVSSRGVMAQCSSEFDDGASKGQFKGQLQCWANENERLRAELKKLQSQAKPHRINLRNWSTTVNKAYDAQKCMTAAFLEMSSRSGVLQFQHPRLVEFSTGDYSVQIVCETKGDMGLVAVSGPERDQADQLADRISRAVYDAATH